MCGGICGPAGEISELKKSGNNPPKKIKQKKVPYKNCCGTVIRSKTYQNGTIEAIKNKRTGEYFISYCFGPPSPASGTKSCRNEYDAITQFNNMTKK